MMVEKTRAVNNRTITLDKAEIEKYSEALITENSDLSIDKITDKIIRNDFFEVAKKLPEKFVDLLFIDPPYNLRKSFNSITFSEKSVDDYTEWLDDVFVKLKHTLKPNASVYVCGDWKSSTSIHTALMKHFYVQNRITWEREKGRGAKKNWKNNTEDIWFATVDKDDYKFNIEAVKLKKMVIAPYRNNDGSPKDWEEDNGEKFRLTHPSNIWTDISVPFWSMPENTDHPTQKPEKLLAKVILASSLPGDFVFDPFIGSGTTLVTAKKLERKYSGIELDNEFCCVAEKRLEMAESDDSIQGFDGKYFWERNTYSLRNKTVKNY